MSARTRGWVLAITCACVACAGAAVAAGEPQQQPSVTLTSDNAAPLVDAVKKGDAQAIRTLLKDPKRVNQPAVDGSTALQWAAHRDDLATIELLLRAGADVR